MKLPTLLNTDNRGRKVFAAEFIFASAPRSVRRPSGEPSGHTGSGNSEFAPGTQTGQQTADNKSVSANDDKSGVVRSRWRLISAVQAWPTTGHYLPQLVDYGHNGGKALKQTIPLINELKPDLTWNHSDDARDVAGHIENAVWEDSKDIPSGVNADLVVDPEFDRKAAAGLKRGSIRNGSIGVMMECRQSHEDMDTEKFMERQGEEVNGEVCRWLVEKTTGVRHMAMLAAGTGADPNAGKRANNQADNRTEPGAHNNKAHAGTNNEESSIGDRHMKELHLQAQLKSFTPDFLKPGETSLTAEKILERMPAMLEMARQGEVYLKQLAKEAVRCFDAAKFTKDKPGLAAHELRLRESIASSRDAQYLLDTIEEYRAQVDARFGPVASNRSSAAEEFPIPQLPVEGLKGFKRDLADSVRRIFPEAVPS